MNGDFQPAFLCCIALSITAVAATAAERTTLTEDNWDDWAPVGKEVDCIYGDIVLRNDRLIAVIAQPISGRNANMTVRNVGGSLIDLTQRNAPNDQLSAFYPGGGRLSLVASDTTAVTPDSGREVTYRCESTTVPGGRACRGCLPSC